VSATATQLPAHTRVDGPTALGGDVRRLAGLTWTLATTDFKVRFFGSALGYLWQLVRPLMLFGVLYFVFATFLDVGDEVRFYPVALLLGIVLYSFVAEATGQGLRSLISRESLLRKIAFPRLAVPLSSILTAVFNLGLNLLPVLVFLVAAGGEPRWSWFAVPLLLVALTLWCAGLAMLLSALFVRYRDVEPVWDVVLQVMLYGTPIFYTVNLVIDQAGEGVARALMANPFAAVLQEMRHTFIDPSHMSTADAMGGTAWLLLPIGIAIVTFVLGTWVFAREAPRVAENL
jgi:ABC-2 type transport system permease protein